MSVSLEFWVEYLNILGKTGSLPSHVVKETAVSHIDGAGLPRTLLI